MMVHGNNNAIRVNGDLINITPEVLADALRILISESNQGCTKKKNSN